MRNTLLVLIGLVVIPLCNVVWATTDLSTLGSPDVVISPNSGPPGTRITITVSHIPDISKASYPYPDLYIYIPFSQPFGTTLSSHCEGQDCFPIYTHDDALNHDFVDRTITFSLPSTNNPKYVFLNGFENSICDIMVNGKIDERFSTLCNTKDEPQGTYQIRLVWLLESDFKQRYTAKTVPFIVTQGVPPSSEPVAENGNTILKEYQNGTISQAQFYAKLKALGWTDEQVRQALAVIGKLPHQMGVSGPDNKLSIYQTNSSTSSVNNTSSQTSTNLQSPRPEIKSHTNTTKIEQNLQNNSSLSMQLNAPAIKSVQNNSMIQLPQNNSIIQSPQNNSIWNYIIIGLSIAAAVIMLGVVIFVKMQHEKKILDRINTASSDELGKIKEENVELKKDLKDSHHKIKEGEQEKLFAIKSAHDEQEKNIQTAIQTITKMGNAKDLKPGLYYIALADLAHSTKASTKLDPKENQIRIKKFIDITKNALPSKPNNFVTFVKDNGDGALFLFTNFDDILQWARKLDKLCDDYNKNCIVTGSSDIYQMFSKKIVHLGEVHFDEGYDPIALAVNQIFKIEQKFKMVSMVITDSVHNAIIPRLNSGELSYTEIQKITLEGEKESRPIWEVSY